MAGSNIAWQVNLRIHIHTLKAILTDTELLRM